MVMYKQNQGLLAKGTVGTQATGGTTMPTRKLMSAGQKSPLELLFGIATGGSSARPPAQPQPQQQAKAAQPVSYGDQKSITELTQALGRAGVGASPFATYEELLSQYNNLSPSAKGLPPATGAMQRRPAGQTGATYYLTPEAPAAKAVAPPADIITPEFRISTTSPYANLVNPYGTDYRTGMMSRVSAQTARQFAPQREQLESRLSGRGITADSPLYQSLMAQQEGLESGARLQAVSAAEEAGIQAAANWDMQRAQGEAGWQQNLQLTAERLARQPAEIGSLEARRDADVAAAAVANLDLETKRKLIDQARAAIEADFKRRGYDAETARLESIAAAQSIERNDPNQWYNAWWWPIAGKVIGAALGGTAGFFIGGPPGALYGAGIGAGLMPSNIPFPQSGGAMSRPPAPGGSFQIIPGGMAG